MDASRNGDQAERSAGQKALAGLRLVREGSTYEDAAQATGSTVRQIESVKGALSRVPEFEAQLESGQLTLNAALTGAGYRSHGPRQSESRMFFGKGDKWAELALRIHQYLSGWKTKGYKFTHVPPKEAERRIKEIDGFIQELQEVRADLVQRSVRATSALSNK